MEPIKPDLGVECVQAIFQSEMVPEPDYTIWRVPIHGDRFYLIQKNNKPLYFPSVTTIIGKYEKLDYHLIQWMIETGVDKGDSSAAKEIFQTAGLYGTFFHILISDLMLKNKIDISEESLRFMIATFLSDNDADISLKVIGDWVSNIRQDLIGFLYWYRKFQPEPYAVEIPLIHPTGKYGGFIDFVGSIHDGKKRINVIIDWKSGRSGVHSDHAIQLTAYKELWEVNYPSKPIDSIYHYSPKGFRLPVGKTVTPYRFKELETSNRWKHYLELFIEEFKPPELKPEIAHGEIDVETDPDDLIYTPDLGEAMFLKGEKNGALDTGKTGESAKTPNHRKDQNRGKEKDTAER